jgi:hypothetical protein
MKIFEIEQSRQIDQVDHNAYGWWVTATGEIIPVPDIMGHTDVAHQYFPDVRLLDASDAAVEAGWLATEINEINPDEFQIYFDDRRVTKTAIRIGCQIVRALGEFKRWVISPRGNNENTYKTYIHQREVLQYLRGCGIKPVTEGATYNQVKGDMEITFDPDTVTADEFKAMYAEMKRMNREVIDWYVNGEKFANVADSYAKMLSLIQHRIDAYNKRAEERRNAWRRHHPELEGLVEMVPTKWLARLKGNDLRYNTDDELVGKIKEEGLKSPIKIVVGKKDRHAYNGEGNHRVDAALKLGIEELPAYVLVYMNARNNGSAQYSHDVDDDLLIPREGYVPSEMKPSQVFKSLSRSSGSTPT